MRAFALAFVPALMVFASTGGAYGQVKCTVPKAPQILVNPVTKDVQYDFSKSSAELSSFQISTVNPYAPGVDTATGGLRADRPSISLDVAWGTMTYPAQQVVCMWYDKIEVGIHLEPKIYIAEEYQKGDCEDAIMEHELQHVRVDREVMNKYSVEIGKAIQAAVNRAGALGPYNLNESEGIKKMLIGHVKSALDTQELLLQQEMHQRQSAIDSLDEYQRVSKICHDAGVKVGRKR